MKNEKYLISIIVPTLNSENHLSVLLESIKKQKFKKCEVIIVDNGSRDKTSIVAKRYKAKIVHCSGTPPQVARQRNLGAKNAKGDYLYFMDHDMELSGNFLKTFSLKIKNKNFQNINAWYIPEKIISNSKILSNVRNFEAMFIEDSVVSAARLVKRNSYKLTDGFDEKLSAGPADWDLDIQLKQKFFSFHLFNKSVYHHEENLNIRKYIFKKTAYIKGEEIYKKKWKNNSFVYNTIVVRQYSLRYRIFWIFVEKGKWKLLIKNLDRYFLFLIIKLSLVFVYVNQRRKYAK